MNALSKIVAAALVALGLAGAAQAHQPVYVPPSTPYVKSRLVQVDVYDRSTGTALPVYGKDGRSWIEGVPGHEYAVRVRNCTGGRILVVTSVDGVNVVSGETAAPSQSGYVLDPYGSVEIQGWRKSLSRTAAFYFTDLGDSYAARTGRPQNVGVIGVAVFEERVAQRITQDTPDWRGRFAQRDEPAPRAEAPAEAKDREDVAASSPPAAPPPAQAVPAPDNAQAAGMLARKAEAQPAAKLGTGHGRNEDSRVTVTSFQRATTSPAEVVSVQYDRRDNLVAMGILPPPAPRIARREPNPFPGMRFTPDP